MLKIEKLTFNMFEECCYLLWDESGECVIIDPGCLYPEERQALYSRIDVNNLRPRAVLLTHGHSDHIFGVRECCEKYGIKAMMNDGERASIEGFNPTLRHMGLPSADSFEWENVREGDVIEFGAHALRVLETPGHSMGGVCYWVESDGILFSGDTLFAGSIGRTDNNWASLETLYESLKDLMNLDGDIDVYPGHGPRTTISKERMGNPFVGDAIGEE